MKTATNLLGVALILVAGFAFAADKSKSDLIMFGGDASRNFVSDETGLPEKWDLKSGKNIKWVAELGSQTYAGPIYYDGKTFVGTNNEAGKNPDLGGDRGNIMAFDAETGEFLWQSAHPKLGAGRVRDDIKIAVKDGFDFIELDGMQGSTGAGSAEVLEYVGIPTLAAIIEAIDALEEIEAREKVQLVLMGGFRDGIDAVKALCLGADAAAFGTATIIAGGCIACMQCHVGQCVTGIATQDPQHESRYKPSLEAQNIYRFLESVRWQIAAITHALGHDDVTQLGRDDLVALTPEAAAITGLPYEPGQRDETDAIAVQVS